MSYADSESPDQTAHAQSGQNFHCPPVETLGTAEYADVHK